MADSSDANAVWMQSWIDGMPGLEDALVAPLETALPPCPSASDRATRSVVSYIARTTIALIVSTIFIWTFVEWLRTEEVVPYVVAPPKIPEAQKILVEANIKVPGSSAIQCYAPATGQLLGFVNPSTPAGIDRAIEQAHLAQRKWARTAFSERCNVLRTILAFVLQNQEEICRIACIDSGKTMVDASLGEVLTTVEKLRWTIQHGEEALRPSRRPTNLLLLYKKNTVRYEPLGVVTALVSWNYPCHNLLGPIISAIFAGNGILVKASENTAWSASYFTSIAKGALSARGHDPNLVQSIVCWPEVADYLTSHGRISHITFIGSRPVARKVATSAAKALIPVVAELGGKDVAIVLDSAAPNLTRVQELLLRGIFQSAGQNCIGIERVIACLDVYDKLVQILEPRIRAIRCGSILEGSDKSLVDMGALISSSSFDRLERLIQSAVKGGARLLVGGQRLNHPVHRCGHYFQPTLLVDVTPDMAIANEECFAPICLMMRADGTTHAIQLANTSEFGLGAGVYGAPGREMDVVVRSLKTGMVSVNDFGSFYAVQLPFGGVRGSGYGRFAGEEGLRGLCNIKAVCEDRWGRLGIMTPLPKPLRYPLVDTSKAFVFLCGLIEFGYGSLRQRILGIVKLIRNG